MSIEEQAAAYLEEARLTLQSAHAIYESAERSDAALWATVVKNGYDAIEQAISAAIAAENQTIPRNHPAKINTFLEIHEIDDEIETTLLEWLRRRSDSHYVDIRGNEINIPHMTFDQEDARRILKDAEQVITLVEDVVALSRQ